MTIEESDRIHAEVAAKGQEVYIDDVVTDQRPGLADRLAAHLVPWAYPEPEPEL